MRAPYLLRSREQMMWPDNYIVPNSIFLSRKLTNGARTTNMGDHLVRETPDTNPNLNSVGEIYIAA
jgi:hypothetical protein